MPESKERRQVFNVWYEGKYTGTERVVKVWATSEAEATRDARYYKKNTERIILVETAYPPVWEPEK